MSLTEFEDKVLEYLHSPAAKAREDLHEAQMEIIRLRGMVEQLQIQLEKYRPPAIKPVGGFTAVVQAEDDPK